MPPQTHRLPHLSLALLLAACTAEKATTAGDSATATGTSTGTTAATDTPVTTSSATQDTDSEDVTTTDAATLGETTSAPVTTTDTSIGTSADTSIGTSADTSIGTSADTSTGADTDTSTGASDSSGTTGEPAIACGGDEPYFPEFDRSCAEPADCTLVFHQIDCCGSYAALGINNDAAKPFAEAEAECAAQYPVCDCVPMPTVADDGSSTPDNNAIEVTCLDGQCISYLP